MVWIVFAVAVRQQVSITAKSSRGKLESRRREPGWDFASYRRPKTHGEVLHTRSDRSQFTRKFGETYAMQDHAETRRPRDRPVDEDAGFTARARLRGFVNPIVRCSMSALTDVLG